MHTPTIKRLGLQPYTETWEAMRAITLQRDSLMRDEIWIVEHPAVFTQGKAGKPEYVRDTQGIPIILSDRGGQVTYHGPGQIVIYLLLDLHRLNLGIRALVSSIEQSIIQTLDTYAIPSNARIDAPGVYVNQAKIASIGLRVRKGFTYHGMAFNYQMDLTPFSYIDPCGHKEMKVTQLYDLLKDKMPSQTVIEERILSFLIEKFSDRGKPL